MVSSLSQLEIIKILLRSIRLSPPGAKWQFIWNPQGSSFSPGGMGFEFFIDYKELRSAAIIAIRQYPAVFSGRSVQDVCSVLKQFLYDHLQKLNLNRVFFSHGKPVTLDTLTPDNIQQRLAHLIDHDLRENSTSSLCLKPARGINCWERVVDKDLIWLPGDADLSVLLANTGFAFATVENGKFPPIRWDGHHTHVGPGDSWFGCIADNDMDADSNLQRIAGALSMALELPYSRQFSGAEMPKGLFSIKRNGAWTFRGAPSIVPPFLNLGFIKIDPSSTEMIKGLFLTSSPKRQRIQVALEFAAAGWQPLGRTGFLNNAIAYDALFGEDGKVKKSILLGIENYASGIDRATERGQLLIKMRNALLHGQYASIEFCPEYLKYYGEFETDPVIDQIRILRTCFWQLSQECSVCKP